MFYKARWYDPALSRWTQPDTVIPEAAQGVQAWDRLAYVNNSPIRYNDLSGNCLDPDYCPPPVPVCPVPPPEWPSTNAIFLSGGPGQGSFDQKAEDSYTNWTASGESSNPGTTGAALAPGVVNDNLVVLRDFGVRWPGSIPDVSGQVYYESAQNGWYFTGVSISNTSYEDIGITRIDVEEYSVFDDSKISSQNLFPYRYPKILSESVGVARAGMKSGIVQVEYGKIPNYNYLNIRIVVRSESGRVGDMGISLSINPPEY
jgi:hypothetical protein